MDRYIPPCFQTVSITEQCTVHFPNLQNSLMQKCTAVMTNRLIDRQRKKKSATILIIY